MQWWTPSPLASASRPESAHCHSNDIPTPDRWGRTGAIMTRPQP